MSVAGRGGAEGRLSLFGEAEQRLVDHVWHVVDEHVRADQHAVERRRTRPLSTVVHLREAQPGFRVSAKAQDEESW